MSINHTSIKAETLRAGDSIRWHEGVTYRVESVTIGENWVTCEFSHAGRKVDDDTLRFPIGRDVSVYMEQDEADERNADPAQIERIKRKMLTLAQAKHLYAAMLQCNEIGATFRFNVTRDDGRAEPFVLTVEEDPDSWAVLVRISDGTIIERYENQSAFAADYGIPL
jgi:hypothetical protein